MTGDQPVGEYPPIGRFDLVPMELRVRAVVAVRGASQALANLIGVDLFPDFTSDFAALLHVPVTPNN
ncbi:hypothetical protein [Mycobacteroides abscessus]|uniref:hypothetical protein n=1 Tax=Mycobacteroides abscessus TaxID=36809 RepID=UPI00092699DF|nr:hypothetical protein [Mycobacteroides abscessus]MDO2974394.1 hypothetical protein [Mycobacteroides abscessus subsp. massiliense]SHW34884.1 Uncharacterised protein [Mycobacteroides abscessus subsp. abscessus]SHX73509.1 Uncharacterised protein [Mycobacteroides abscessus subsp. abscessus]SHY15495.1 Uncharacterised protein [Mycobacteroides abscessus subsp. abscessus]SHY87517.1 Uncharacterised protein [Mycobacteroides abscessus subsp. abscessus]